MRNDKKMIELKKAGEFRRAARHFARCAKIAVTEGDNFKAMEFDELYKTAIIAAKTHLLNSILRG